MLLCPCHRSTCAHRNLPRAKKRLPHEGGRQEVGQTEQRLKGRYRTNIPGVTLPGRDRRSSVHICAIYLIIGCVFRRSPICNPLLGMKSRSLLLNRGTLNHIVHGGIRTGVGPRFVPGRQVPVVQATGGESRIILPRQIRDVRKKRSERSPVLRTVVLIPGTDRTGPGAPGHLFTHAGVLHRHDFPMPAVLADGEHDAFLPIQPVIAAYFPGRVGSASGTKASSGRRCSVPATSVFAPAGVLTIVPWSAVMTLKVRICSPAGKTI